MIKIFLPLLFLATLSANLFACDRGTDYLCRGDVVIDRNNNKATVIAVFKDGRVSLSLYSNRSVKYVRNIESLARTIGCAGLNKCVGDTIIDIDNDKAIIKGIFKNKRISLTLKSNSAVMYDRAASEVAVTKGCLNNFDICVGDIVVDGENDEAIVEGLFNRTNRISLTLKSNSAVDYDRAASDVGLINDCSEFRR